MTGFYSKSDVTDINRHLHQQKENIAAGFSDRLAEMMWHIVDGCPNQNIYDVNIGFQWPMRAAFFRRAQDGYRFKAYLKGKKFICEKV